MNPWERLAAAAGMADPAWLALTVPGLLAGVTLAAAMAARRQARTLAGLALVNAMGLLASTRGAPDGWMALAACATLALCALLARQGASRRRLAAALAAACLAGLAWMLPPRLAPAGLAAVISALAQAACVILLAAHASRTGRRGAPGARHARGQAQAPSEAAQLRELLAAHRHAAALLAHELRGPLATLGAASQSLELALAGTGEEIDARLACMRRAICRLDELAGKFVTHERLARRMIDPQQEAVDLASLAHEVVAAMQPDTAHVLHIVPGAPAHGWCDRALCAEVLRNLIHNAVKYSPADQPVTIAFGRAPDGAVWISVADQGPGIAAEDLARVFDADYRGTPHRETRGTGQGLYLSRQICLRQGGNLEVDSTPGRGAGTAAPPVSPRRNPDRRMRRARLRMMEASSSRSTGLVT